MITPQLILFHKLKKRRKYKINTEFSNVVSKGDGFIVKV